MKLNAKKFGKIFAEPNRPTPAEPRTEPKFRSLPIFNYPFFLCLITKRSDYKTYILFSVVVVVVGDRRVRSWHESE